MYRGDPGAGQDGGPPKGPDHGSHPRLDADDINPAKIYTNFDLSGCPQNPWFPLDSRLRGNDETLVCLIAGLIRQAIADNGLVADDIRTMIGYFERIVLLDYGVQPYSDEDILSYYDLLQVPIEIEPVQMNYFKGVLDRLLEQP